MASKAVFTTAAISMLISTPGGMKMRDENGMLREVYISCHDFCHTFRWYENEGRAISKLVLNTPRNPPGSILVAFWLPKINFYGEKRKHTQDCIKRSCRPPDERRPGRRRTTHAKPKINPRQTNEHSKNRGKPKAPPERSPLTRVEGSMTHWQT